MENLDLRIYELRKAKGFTQEELATRMGSGTNRSMICKWEKGVETPSLTSAKRLISALGCSLDFLVAWGETKHG